MAALLDVRLEDGRVAAVLEGERLVTVVDCLSETQERLEFRDPVVKMSLGRFGVCSTERFQAMCNALLVLGVRHLTTWANCA
jgi:hypothetical protein